MDGPRGWGERLIEASTILVASLVEFAMELFELDSIAPLLLLPLDSIFLLFQLRSKWTRIQ